MSYSREEIEELGENIIGRFLNTYNMTIEIQLALNSLKICNGRKIIVENH